MKFFWPAPLDLIDPTYNFRLEEGNFKSTNQKKQKFPHEIFTDPIYHGFLISKAHIDKSNKTRWNSSQLNRFLREGAKKFLKIPTNSSLEIMGDSGAYTNASIEYLNGDLIDECLESISFYNAIDVDYGLSPDKIISGSWSQGRSSRRIEFPSTWEGKWNRNLELASTFWEIHKRKQLKWKPIGVAQGWDSNSYQKSVIMLQQIGYSYIALGGLNRLNNEEIINCVKACYEVKLNNTSFHLLGISRMEQMISYAEYGISSFDSTMPLRQAINSDKDNYHYFMKNYLAIRVPQTHSSPRLKQSITKYGLDISILSGLERTTLDLLRSYDKGAIDVEEVLSILKSGIDYRKEKDHIDAYQRLLLDKPWKECPCLICKETGIEIVLFRNKERNLRRSFHNLYILSQSLKKLFPASWK